MYQLNVSSEFNKRTKSVFDSLETLEVKHKSKETEYATNELEEEETQETPIVGDAVFKVPEVPKRLNESNDYKVAKKQKSRPDFEINPNKWKKYSLEDVKETTSSSNYNAAMSFIASRQMIVEEDDEIEDVKIEFNKPIGKKVKIDLVEEEKEGDELEKEILDTNEFKKPKKNRNSKQQQRRRVDEDETDLNQEEPHSNDINLKEVETNSSESDESESEIDINNYLA